MFSWTSLCPCESPWPGRVKHYLEFQPLIININFIYSQNLISQFHPEVDANKHKRFLLSPLPSKNLFPRCFALTLFLSSEPSISIHTIVLSYIQFSIQCNTHFLNHNKYLIESMVICVLQGLVCYEIRTLESTSKFALSNALDIVKEAPCQ